MSVSTDKPMKRDELLTRLADVAVKLYREKTGLGLKESLDAVNALEAEMKNGERG